MKPVEIQFVNERVKEAFEKISDDNLKRLIERALEDIEENPFCGIQISKRLIPKEYVKSTI